MVKYKKNVHKETFWLFTEKNLCTNYLLHDAV